MTMVWWEWLVLGLVLAGIELVTPGGFYVIFFGVAALVVGGLSLAGLSGPLWLQWLLFSTLSIATLLLFRNPLLRLLGTNTPGPNVDTMTGETALPLDTIAPGAVGRAELRGTVWQARNVGSTTLAQGQRCIVTRVDGLQISIQPEGAV